MTNGEELQKEYESKKMSFFKEIIRKYEKKILINRNVVEAIEHVEQVLQKNDSSELNNELISYAKKIQGQITPVLNKEDKKAIKNTSAKNKT